MTDGSGKDGTGPPIRLFAYSHSRSTKTALELYAGIREGAVLMTDGYEVYDVIAENHKLVHLGYWAHCRRRCCPGASRLVPSAQSPRPS